MSKPTGGGCGTIRPSMWERMRYWVAIACAAGAGTGIAARSGIALGSGPAPGASAVQDRKSDPVRSAAGRAAGPFLEGLQLAEDGRLDEAIERIRVAAEIDSAAPEIPRQLASLLLDAARPEEALVQAGRALALSPDDPFAHWLAGRSWIMLRNAEEAIASFRRAWELEPEKEEYIVSLLLAYEGSGHEREALDLLEPDRGGVDPDTPYLLFRRGTLRTRFGMPERALDDFLEVLRYSSNYPGAVDRLIALSWRLGPSDHLAAVLSEACGRAPDRVDLRRELARVHLALGKQEEAVPSLEWLRQREPDDGTVAMQLGVIRFSQDRAPEAIPLIRDARRIDPNLKDSELWLWRALNRADSLEAALAVAREMASRSPSDPDAHWYIGISLARLGRQEEALAALDAVERLDPSHRESHLLAAVILEEEGRMDEARQRLVRALESRPTDRDILFRLAGLELRSQRTEEALGWFRILIAAHPDDATSLNEAGYLCAEKGIHLEDALVWTSRAAAIDGGNAAFLDSFGWSLYRVGRLEEALEQLRRASALDPNQTEIGIHLAIVLKDLGRTEEAAAALRKVLAGNPGDRKARELIQLWEGGKPDSTGNPRLRLGVRTPRN